MAIAARTAPLLLVVVVESACGVMRPTPGAAPPTAPSRHVLPNGVRLIVEEHRAADVVALQLWVRVGGRDETRSEVGLAHYLEHTLFKGTPTRSRGFIDREVEGVGGRMNAGTSLDYTYYHAVLPAGRALEGVEMLADIAVNASLDESALEQEKRVVLEEMRLGEDNPRRRLSRGLYEVVFDGHPYGRPVIGNPSGIQALARDALAGFYRRYYVPESFTLVVVGAVSRAEVLAAATRTFGRLPRSGHERLPAPQPGDPRPGRVTVERRGSQAYVGLGWLGPRIDDADTPALDLVAWILGGTRSSRLVRSLRDGLGLVDSISSGFAALEAAGIVTVTAQLPPANLRVAEREILREVRRLGEEGPSEAERRRAVAVAEARHAFREETAEGRAYAYGRAETVWRLEDELAYVDRLRSVTAAQLRAVARRYLDPERYARFALVPPATP